MNTQSVWEYIAAHGGAMRAFREYLEEHALALPGTSAEETSRRELSLLAGLRPCERLHRVAEYLTTSAHYVFHCSEERRNP